MTMRSAIALMSLCILASLTPGMAPSAGAQAARNIALSTSQPRGGSAPFREAVDRFLQRKEPKIVGGQVAPVGAYPWQVSLGVSWIADPYHAHFCGGTVYSASWIVTAAHCLEDTPPRDVIVTAGTNTLSTNGTRRNVNRIIVKSDFNRPTRWDNDIALIELFDPLPLGEAIKAIPVLTSAEELNLLKPDMPVVVVGWGATTEGGKKVRDLRFVEVPFVDRATCNRPLAYDGKITTNMLCAGQAAGGQDSCQGDSGGPLTVNTLTAPALAGVVSWGEGCARPNKVGIYARAANYVNWIAACVARPTECK
jgi:secreted trypsin-like serine protease